MQHGGVPRGKMRVGLSHGSADVETEITQAGRQAADIHAVGVGLPLPVHAPPFRVLLADPTSRRQTRHDPEILSQRLIQHLLIGRQRCGGGRGRGLSRLPDGGHVRAEPQTMREADVFQARQFLSHILRAVNAPHHHGHPVWQGSRHQRQLATSLAGIDATAGDTLGCQSLNHQFIDAGPQRRVPSRLHANRLAAGHVGQWQRLTAPAACRFQRQHGVAQSGGQSVGHAELQPRGLHPHERVTVGNQTDHDAGVGRRAALLADLRGCR